MAAVAIVLGGLPADLTTGHLRAAANWLGAVERSDWPALAESCEKLEERKAVVPAPMAELFAGLVAELRRAVAEREAARQHA